MIHFVTCQPIPLLKLRNYLKAALSFSGFLLKVLTPSKELHRMKLCYKMYPFGRRRTRRCPHLISVSICCSSSITSLLRHGSLFKTYCLPLTERRYTREAAFMYGERMPTCFGPPVLTAYCRKPSGNGRAASDS